MKEVFINYRSWIGEQFYVN